MRYARRCAGWIVAACLVWIAGGCGGAPDSGPETPTFTEDYRPQYHFTPATNWMNDPNGMVRGPDGTYDLG